MVLESIKACQILLNIFGFYLEEKEKIDLKYRIFDSNNNYVGRLFLNSDKIVFSINYDNISFKGSSVIPNINTLVDIEDSCAFYGMWNHNIDFTFENRDLKIDGKTIFNCSVDSLYGYNCLCQSDLQINYDDYDINLEFRKNNLFFLAEIDKDDYHELIRFSPNDNIGNFITHDIKSGKFCLDTLSYPFRRYSTIFSEDDSDKELHILLNEVVSNTVTNYRSETIPIVSDNDNTLLNKFLVFKKLDNDLYDKIKKLKDVLSFNNCSIFENILSVCFDDYSSDYLNLIFECRKNNNLYQNNYHNLTNYFFEIDKNNKKELKKIFNNTNN